MTKEKHTANGESILRGALIRSFVTEKGETEVLELAPESMQRTTAEDDFVSKTGQPTSEDVLEALFADLGAFLKLHLQYKGSEWTIEGRHWYIHRSSFVDLGCAALRSSDLVAERIVALGGWPAPNLCHKQAQARSATGSVSRDAGGEMLSVTLRMERDIVDQLDDQIELADQNGDCVTRDLFSHLRAKHAHHVDELMSIQSAQFRLPMTA